MKLIGASIFGAGALIALTLAYNGTQERLQNDCKSYVRTILKEGDFGTARAWDASFVKSNRDQIAKIFKLSDSHKKYCAW